MYMHVYACICMYMHVYACMYDHVCMYINYLRPTAKVHMTWINMMGL